MMIKSSAFEYNKLIPPQYTCDGENISPPLTFSDIPHGAKSLVLINYDPDAPVGLWVHWTVWNINPIEVNISEGSQFKSGVEGVTSFGSIGYGGPCPPGGTHRYFFKVYALNTMLDLDSSATKTDIEKAMQGHIIAQAEIIGLYSRN